jgi:hypothetical protein
VFTFLVSSLACTYLLVLVAGYYLEIGDIRRHHIESASFIFVAVFLIQVLSRRRVEGTADAGSGTSSLVEWIPSPGMATLGLFVLAFAVYAPVIRAGLFADDFVLLEASREGRWTVWTEFFRPVTFFVWRNLDRLPGDVGQLLHVLNIGLHALNACLLIRLGERIGLEKSTALATGLLFLSFPAAVEAVAWPAGIQDVLMTACVLGSLLMLTAPSLTVGSSALCIVLALTALLTKETGVVAAPLALMTCTMMRAGRQRWALALAEVAVVGAALIVRFALVPPGGAFAPTLSRYGVKELLTRPFSALAVPLRLSEVTAMPWLPLLLITAVLISLVIAGGRWNRRSRDFHRVLFGVAFVLLAVAPVGSAFFVSDDLLGSRYLYLAAAGWSIVLAIVLRSAMARISARARVTAIIPLAVVVCWLVITSVHVRLWTEAGQRRDAILEAAERAVPAGCGEVTVLDLPETHAGVPLFVNGFSEAMRQQLPNVRFHSVASAASEECRLTWMQSGFTSSRK